MNLRIFLGLTLLFFLTNGMSCFDEDTEWRLVALNTRNVNNEGESYFISDDSIKRTAYAISIEYKGEGKKGYIYNGTSLEKCKDTIVERRIICNNDFNSTLLAGSDVTDFFKPLYGEFTQNSKGKKLYGGVFVLLHTPRSGVHSFKVRMYRKDGTFVESDTTPIKLH